MYTIVEFRRNIRQAFNEADKHQKVLIERFGELYELRHIEERKTPQRLPGTAVRPTLKPIPKLITLNNQSDQDDRQSKHYEQTGATPDGSPSKSRWVPPPVPKVIPQDDTGDSYLSPDDIM
jgi:hypothetical protein